MKSKFLLFLYALTFVLMLSACSSSSGGSSSSGSNKEWSKLTSSCVKEHPEPPLRRIINHVDRNLCGRPLPGLGQKRKYLRDEMENISP
jgi:hypothetical protein